MQYHVDLYIWLTSESGSSNSATGGRGSSVEDGSENLSNLSVNECFQNTLEEMQVIQEYSMSVRDGCFLMMHQHITNEQNESVLV